MNTNSAHRLSRTTARLLATSAVGAFAIFGAIDLTTASARAEVSPAAQQQPDALTKARADIKSGNYGAAMVALKNLVRANPKLVDAHVELATLYNLAHDGAASEKEWRAAMQNGYPFEKALDGLGQSILAQGRAQQLLKEFDPAKFTGEVRVRVHLIRAQAHLALTETALAKQELEFARAIQPNHAGVYLLSSKLHQIEGDLKAAEADVDKALAIAATDSDSLLQKGELRGAQGDAAGALQYFDRVLQNDKSDIRARLGRAAALVAQRQPDAADSELNDILKVAPGSPIASYFKALVLAQKGKRDEALALLGRIQGIEKLPAALYLLSALHLAKGETEQARRYIDAYVLKAPDDARGQLLQIALQLAHGEVANTLPRLEAIKAKLPNDYTTALLLGNAYLSLGRFADATSQFQTAAAASQQGDQQANMGLAESLLGQGKSDEGAKILETLSAQNYGGGRADALLVTSLVKAKKFDAALKAADAYAARQPKSPAPAYLRASVDVARNDRAAARLDLEKALKLDATFSPAHLALALFDRAENKVDDARAHYQAALAQAPASLDAHVGLATLALDSGDKQGALDWLKKAAAANDTTPTARLLLINFLVTQRRIDDALKEATELSMKFPTNTSVVDALGVCQLLHRDGNGAVISFAKLVNFMPNSAIANIKLAAAYRLASKPKDAQRALEAALKFDPQSVEARRALVELAFAQDGADAALKSAQTAKTALTDKSAGALIVADTYRMIGRNAEAETAYRDLWKQEPSSGLLVRYTQLLEVEGKMPASRAVIDEWLKTHPTDGGAKFLTVVNAINAAQYPAALKLGENLFKERPKDIALLNNLAWLYAQTGNNQKAIEYAEKAYAQAPWSPEVADTLGWLLIKDSKLERGVSILKAAHDGAPSNVEISYHYAFALNRSGKAQEARTLLGDALKASQPFTERKDAEKFLASLH